MENYFVGFQTFMGLSGNYDQAARNLFQRKPCIAVAMLVRGSVGLQLLVAAAVLAACANGLCGQDSGTFRVNPKESQIEIHLFKGGFLSSLGDNHLISLTQFTGTADLSPSSPWKADLLANAGSLKVIDPWGDPAERREVQGTMLGPQQLDVSHFPKITLHSISFDPTKSDETWHLVANVELHGVTRKVQFSLDCHQIGDKLKIHGQKMFKLTDFNIQPYSRAFGAVKVKNDFQVTYNIVLDRVH